LPLEIKAMVWAASEEIYSEHYGNFQNLCEESNLMLETEKLLLDYFIDNWHNCKEDWVIFYKRFIPYILGNKPMGLFLKF